MEQSEPKAVELTFIPRDVLQDLPLPTVVAEYQDSLVMWGDRTALFGDRSYLGSNTLRIKPLITHDLNLNFIVKTNAGEPKLSQEKGFVHKGVLYVYGGIYVNNTQTNYTIYRLAFNNLHWEQMIFKNQIKPQNRYRHEAFAWDDSIYFYGGLIRATDNSNSDYLPVDKDMVMRVQENNYDYLSRELFRYCLKSEEWSTVEQRGDIPPFQSFWRTLVVENKLYTCIYPVEEKPEDKLVICELDLFTMTWISHSFEKAKNVTYKLLGVNVEKGIPQFIFLSTEKTDFGYQARLELFKDSPSNLTPPIVIQKLNNFSVVNEIIKVIDGIIYFNGLTLLEKKRVDRRCTYISPPKLSRVCFNSLINEEDASFHYLPRIIPVVRFIRDKILQPFEKMNKERETRKDSKYMLKVEASLELFFESFNITAIL